MLRASGTMNTGLEHRHTDGQTGPPVLPSEWELRIATGGGAGRVLLVPTEGGLVGADPACKLRICGEGVAPFHLRISRRQDGALGWECTEPTASVLLEGRPARTGPLVDGSRLQVGAVVVTVARRAQAGLPSLPSAPPEAPDQLLAPGTILGDRYRIDGVIGQGGMGTVYRAEHLTLGKSFAVKVLKAAHTARPDFVARFEREAVAASQIRHPGIVDVVDFGRTEAGGFYCAMEHLSGETLAVRLAREGALPVVEAVRIGHDMARALAAAHVQGIFHRDIKPENVLLVPAAGAPDAVKLVDFGIARLADSPPDGRETGGGQILGTPQYMSPEQASGLSQDARADIYSLGVLLWELLVGVPPFRGMSATHVLAAHLLEPAPRLPDNGPHGPIPRRLSRLVTRMMAKPPEDRPERMEEVIAELDAALVPPTPRLRWRVALLGTLAIGSTVAAVWVARHRQRPVTGRTAVASLASPAPPLALAPVVPAATTVSAAPLTPAAPSSGGLAVRRIPINVNTEPLGAIVEANGRPVGTTPLRLQLREGKPTQLEFSLAGYARAARVVQAHPGLAVTVRLRPVTRPDLSDLKDSPY
jgi:eukaryotic-like serine/threonine-protein kinase